MRTQYDIELLKKFIHLQDINEHSDFSFTYLVAVGDDGSLRIINLKNGITCDDFAVPHNMQTDGERSLFEICMTKEDITEPKEEIYLRPISYTETSVF